ANVCPCALASASARSMISQRYFPCSGSSAVQYQRRYAMVVSGKSGLLVAGGNFSTGPSSDHSIGGFGACPLKRLNGVNPMLGLSRTSLMGVGRTITVLRCASRTPPKKTMTRNDRMSFMDLLKKGRSKDRRASQEKITKRKQRIRGEILHASNRP